MFKYGFDDGADRRCRLLPRDPMHERNRAAPQPWVGKSFDSGRIKETKGKGRNHGGPGTGPDQGEHRRVLNAPMNDPRGKRNEVGQMNERVGPSVVVGRDPRPINELGNGSASPRRRNHNLPRIVENRNLGETARSDLVATDLDSGNVQFARPHQTEKRGVGHFTHAQVELGMALADGGERRGDHGDDRRLERAEVDGASDDGLAPPDFGSNRFERLFNLKGRIEKRLARRCESYGTLTSIAQNDTYGRFEAGQLLRDCRRGHVQRISGGTHAAVAMQGQQGE